MRTVDTTVEEAAYDIIRGEIQAMRRRADSGYAAALTADNIVGALTRHGLLRSGSEDEA